MSPSFYFQYKWNFHFPYIIKEKNSVIDKHTILPEVVTIWGLQEILQLSQVRLNEKAKKIKTVDAFIEALRTCV